MSDEHSKTTPLRARRLAQQPRPWTQERLMHELERAAQQLGMSVAARSSLKIQVSRWENGHVAVGPEYRALFRLVYGATDQELGFVTAAPGAGQAQGVDPIDFGGAWIESFDRATKEWNLDVERRHFLRAAAYVAATATVPTLQWLLCESERNLENDGVIPIDLAHVDGIREMSKMFRMLDNRFGGAHARESLVRFLAEDVSRLVGRGKYDSATGYSLLSAVAEAVQLAGWMSFDAGLQGLGQRYMIQALRMAMAAGDRPLGAEILAGLSHQASYLGHASTAIDLARAAGRTARDCGTPALLAEAAVMEAHGHACAGDSASCIRSLSLAEKELDRADRTADPQWIGYFDEAYLSAKFGHCFIELRQPKEAAKFARRSLDMNNSYVRGRAFNLSLLATAHAQAGEVDAACNVGAEALMLARGINSERAKEYIQTLCRELSIFDSPVSRAFGATVEEMLTQAV